MDSAVTVLIGAVSGLLSALIIGSAAYVKIARSTLTREEHDRECDRRMKPVLEDIKEIKRDIKGLSAQVSKATVKQDESTSDLARKLQEILKAMQRRREEFEDG